MGNRVDHTAVGAGTTAGSAWDPHSDKESRAAEAETDDMLESLRTTGARPAGVPGAKQETGHGGDSESPPGPVAPLHPEGPREDLAQNRAGIASRVEVD